MRDGNTPHASIPDSLTLHAGWEHASRLHPRLTHSACGMGTRLTPPSQTHSLCMRDGNTPHASIPDSLTLHAGWKHASRLHPRLTHSACGMETRLTPPSQTHSL